MIVRQSDLKLFQRCPLQYRYQKIDNLPREQGASATFGSIVHDCVMFMEVSRDVDAAVERFRQAWLDPTTVDPTYKIDYYERGRSWKKFAEDGPKILRNWWELVKWDTDVVLAREHEFEVPIGSSGHRLHGTVDNLALRYVPKLFSQVVLIRDLKTNRKVPTYEWLEDDLQFTAYSYASTKPEFWDGIPGGQALYQKCMDCPRMGEWVQLSGPRRMDAGIRTDVHYRRLEMAVDAIADSVSLRVFVPNISGESCRYCEYRRRCGLPDVQD